MDLRGVRSATLRRPVTIARNAGFIADYCTLWASRRKFLEGFAHPRSGCGPQHVWRPMQCLGTSQGDQHASLPARACQARVCLPRPPECARDSHHRWLSLIHAAHGAQLTRGVVMLLKRTHRAPCERNVEQALVDKLQRGASTRPAEAGAEKFLKPSAC